MSKLIVHFRNYATAPKHYSTGIKYRVHKALLCLNTARVAKNIGYVFSSPIDEPLVSSYSNRDKSDGRVTCPLPHASYVSPDLHLFVEPECSLPRSQQPAPDLYPEPRKSSTHPPTFL